MSSSSSSSSYAVPGAVANFEVQQSSDTSYYLTWDAEPNSVNYTLTVSNATFVGITTLAYNLTNLTLCTDYNATIVGVNAVGVAGPQNANTTLSTDCPAQAENVTTNTPTPNAVYSLVSFANTSLCIGIVRSFTNSFALNNGFSVAVQMLVCADRAANQQFLFNSTGQLSYGNADPPGSLGLGVSGGCAATNALQVGRTLTFLFAYNTVTLQLTACTGAWCVQSGGVLSSGATLQTCAGSTPTQQWELGAPTPAPPPPCVGC